MFVKTFKLRKPSKIFFVVALSIVVLLVFLLSLSSCEKRGLSFEMNNEAERKAFLIDLGWEISEEYVSSKVVVIPKKFGSVYNQYNKLQKEQGFDLSSYKGKTVEIYTYEIKNYPNKKENVVANLIILDGKLIGGDVCCTELDGFMQGFVRPTA